MSTSRTLPRLAAAALLALIWGGHAAAGPPLQGPVFSGPAQGSWHLPEPPSTTGSVQGVLLSPAGKPLFDLDGVLTEFVSPCLSCREGYLNGTLDDGGGGLPEYVVTGNWLVTQLTGEGVFRALVYKPIGPFLLPVGRLEGLVDDPPFPPGQAGTFIGRWWLRR